jgi:tetratricopeptide (TPR) repeat protein
MGKNAKFKNAVGLIAVVLIMSGLVYGCYSRGAGIEEKGKYDQEIKPDPLSEAEIRKFAASVRKVDGEAEANYQLALYFQERWRHKLAIDELKQVLMRNPVHAKAYNALGVSYDNLGDHDAAIDYYKLALNIDSKLDYAYNNLGYSYLLKGDNQRAVEVFQQAIALNGKEKRYRNNLGLAYVKQDKYELAFEQFNALDSDANAQKTLAKVMKDLGKGSDTERVLLAVKSAPKVEPAAEAAEPINRFPELIAAKPETASRNDPVERFRFMKNSIESPSSDYVEANAGVVENSKQAEDAAEESEESADDEEDVLAEVKEETLTGPVINLSPAAKQNTNEIKIASAPHESGFKEVVAKNEKPAEYYHVSSIALSQDTLQKAKPESAGKLIVAFQEKPVTKKPIEILPPKFEIAARMDQEESEERILVASSSTKAGGWQNAPEPKRTAEKGIIEVEVANGNGVKGAAGKVAEHLRRSGFKVVKVMDANSFDHFSTKVFYYGGSLKEVQRMLKAIPEIADDAELYELQNMGNHIRLLIGKDLVNRNKDLAWNKLPSN